MNGEADRRANALALRLWLNCLATQEILCCYLGIQLGYYEALARGPANAAELAERTQTAARYTREWLEQQAVAGLIAVEDTSQPAHTRRFFLPEPHRHVLLASDGPLSRVAGILPVGAVAHVLPRLIQAYRTGAGLVDADYGPDWTQGHAGSNAAFYSHALPTIVRSALSRDHLLLAGKPTQLAEIGCGAGWATTSLARTFPNLSCIGFDIDPDMIHMAERHSADLGLTGRARFEVRDCYGGLPSQFDIVCIFDVLHELPKPVEMLGVARLACRSGGTVLLIDARTQERFQAPADEIERFQYTTSVLHCLPVGHAGENAQPTGTIMREKTVREMATTAGFGSFERIAIADRLHSCYRLGP
jgi:2-polyprenyl-3-methyl-5-hydroxy-6-metoxy-1,4-benzoquinol methylase